MRWRSSKRRTESKAETSSGRGKGPRRGRRAAVLSVVGLSAALAALVVSGGGTALAHTTTATLFPNGQGTYTAWTNGESEIDETGATDCSSDESVIEGSGTGDRESVIISLASIPDGATITSVDVQAGYRDHDESGSDGTFQTSRASTARTPTRA